jgi:4-amino-4-deoxy-L-arabinose transferase-like glycosyltransferase/L-ascorbate metabolism protein UlaG (beta-lactamase superfamily)
LLVIVAIAVVADAWDITTDGLESYYAAGVRSMAGSWHDFLYGAFDPHGMISLDKLPGPFWVQALSVRTFGLSVWAMVWPQVLWSVLTVVVLFLAVRRVAGPAAGLAAAAILAISPVTIISAHGNLGDPLFVLLGVLAADAAVRATRGDGGRWLMLAAIWIGLAFQVKMAEAWLVAAPLAATYLLAGPIGLRGRLVRLGAAGSVLAVVSLGWLVFVTLTPAHDRPYADGSLHNSVFEQVFLYNGTGRFGDQSAYGLGYAAAPSAASVAYARQLAAFFPPVYESRPAWDRLLTAPVAQITGWLLVPAAIVAVAGIIAVSRARGQAARREHAPVLLWGLWLLTYTVIFSASDGLQSYYFAILSPAIAVLCALGAKAALDRIAVFRWRVAFGAGVAAAALWSAAVLAEAGPSWRAAAFAAGATALVTGAVAIGLIARRHRGRLARIALALTATAGLSGPLIADGWLLAHRAGPFDAPLSPGGTFAASAPSLVTARLDHPGYGGTILPTMSAARWQQLQATGRQDQGAIPPGTWFAVYGPAASSYVLGGVRQVLPIGGFTGSVPVPSASQLTRMLDRGQIAWAEIPGPGDVRFNDPRVQVIIRYCIQADHFGDMTARGRIYDCQQNVASVAGLWLSAGAGGTPSGEGVRRMTSSSGGWTVEWFGTATFRVRRPGLDLFFDGYLDRLPGLDPVGLTTGEVGRADFVFVSHAHFDHLYGVAPIARLTGATVVASPESARVLRQDGIPEDQILMVTGGETVACGPAASVRVLPALHSCLFAASDPDSAAECLGDLGISAQDRSRAVQGILGGEFPRAVSPLAEAMKTMLAHSSVHDGGQLAFLLQAADSSALFSGSSGYWPGIFAGLRPDVAFLALAGRPNVSGEPYQGSSARFMLEQVQALRPGKVCFCHHDPLLPGLPGTDTAEAAALIDDHSPGSHFTLEYATARHLFA